MEGEQKRSNKGTLSGETSVRYRYVFEFNNPIKGRKKQEDGTNDIYRIEMFGSSEELFYLLHATISRAMTDPSQLKRSEAVTLTDESVVHWTDRNPNEEE